MKKLLLFLLFTTTLFGQNEPEFSWVNSQSNSQLGGAVAIINSVRDASGNLYNLGTFANSADFDPSANPAYLTSVGTTDMFIAKYDSNGNYLWAKNIGGPGTIAPQTITIGGSTIYTTGSFTGIIDFNPSTTVTNNKTSNGKEDIFIGTYDLNGNYLASKSIGGSESDMAYDIKYYNNEIFIAGYFSDIVLMDSTTGLSIGSEGLKDVFFAKYNINLDLQFINNIGGPNNDYASSLAIDTSGDVIITGMFRGTVDFDPYFGTVTINSSNPAITNTYIAKYTNSGIFSWVKNIGGSNSGTPVNKISLGSLNSIYIAGTYSLSSDFDPSVSTATLSTSGSNVFIARYDNAGNYVWAKAIGSTGTDTLSSLSLGDSDALYITGAFGGTVDFDPSANTASLNSSSGTGFFAQYTSTGTYSYAYNLSAALTSIIPYTDSGDSFILVAGNFNGNIDFDPSASLTNYLYTDIGNGFFGKYNNIGTRELYFAKQIGHISFNNVANFIASDTQNKVYKAGNITGTCDLDPSLNISNVTSAGWTDFYLAKYTSDGALIWGKSIEGLSANVISVMNTDPAGNTYIVGRFMGTLDFDPSANVSNLINTTNGNETFIAKYDTDGNLSWAKKIGAGVGVFDNIEFDAQGNLYFVGRFAGTVDFDPSAGVALLTCVGAIDMFFVKFNPQGELLWAKGIISQNAGVGAANETRLYVKSGNIYITGAFFDTFDFDPSVNTAALQTLNTIGISGFLAKYDLDGNYVFAFALSEITDTYNIWGANVLVDTSSNIYFITDFEGQVDFNPSTTAASNIVSTGRNMGIAKYSSNGDFLWAKSTQGNDPDGTQNNLDFRNTQAFIDADSNLIINGTFRGIYDFDPTNVTYDLTSSHNATTDVYKSNIFYAKYNSNGELLYASKLSGDYEATVTSAALTANLDFLFTGNYTGTVDFDFSANTSNITSSSFNYPDSYFAKYSVGTLANTIFVPNGKISIYPNPVSHNLYIDTDSLNPLAVKIYDITGKLLADKTIALDRNMDVSHYPQGVYIIEIYDLTDKSKSLFKFLKN